MSFRLYMFSVILLLFASCTKTAFRPPSVNNQEITTLAKSVTTATPIPIQLTDTIPPANAVDVKKYNAQGNGFTDDTNALQNAINTETSIVLSQGTYIINNTLKLRAGVKIYGTNGATIKAGTQMRGTLLTNGRYIYVNKADDCLINNVRFQQSSQVFTLSAWSNACIYILNSKGTGIKFNNFDFNLPYSKSSFEGVWISGTSSANTIISNNKFISAGIEYAESGAGGTTVDGNYIKNAPSDAISAHGNTSTYCVNNIVKNNIIEDAGFMGIEDWGNIDGTIISNNIITGTGKDPDQRLEGMGISVGGVNAMVNGNSITDAHMYYIEAMGSNNVINNTINANQGAATAIIVNFTRPRRTRAADLSTVANNIITNSDTSILVFGNYSPNVNIKSNTIINPTQIGINIENDTATYTANVADNNISFTIPNGQIRMAFKSYARLKHGKSVQNIILNNNTITYAPTAAGGAGLEYGLEIGTDNTIITNNRIDGNNIKAGGALVYAITGNTDPAYSITLTNNLVYNAIVNLKDFVFKVRSGNNF